MTGACGRDCDVCPARVSGACSGCPGCGRALNCSGCRGCGYVCPDRPGARAFLHAVLGGPDFPPRPRAKVTQPSAELPTHIPAVAAPFRLPPPPMWLAIHAARAVFRADGRGLRPVIEKHGVRWALNLHPETPLALHFYVPDRPLEGFWHSRQDLYPWIGKQFNLVFAPNFSVYEDAPRMEHIINIKRSATVYSEMVEAGIPAVPDIGWYEVRDLDRWAAWLNEVRPPLVAFSFQGVGLPARSSNAWRGYLAGLRYLHERLREDIGIILVSVAAPTRVAAAVAAVPGRRVLTMNTLAWGLSRKGRCIDNTPADRGTHRDEVFLQNLADLGRAYGTAMGKGGGDAESVGERCTPPLRRVRA